MKKILGLVLACAVAVGVGAEQTRPRLLEDFEDGDTNNSALDNGIAGSNGYWITSCDSYGVTKISGPEIVELDGGKALHVSGAKGTSASAENKWVYTSIQTCFGGDDKWADLRPSTGMSFRARSDMESAINVTVEGLVNGKQLAGTSTAHFKRVKLGGEWAEHTVYWEDLKQPGWACPGDNCVGALRVDHVGHLFWDPAEEGKDFDIWLDDIKLVYEKKVAPPEDTDEAQEAAQRESEAAQGGYVYFWESFERELNWKVDWQTSGYGRQLDEHYASEGGRSLKLSFYAKSDSARAGYYIDEEMDWTSYERVLLDIYNPTELENVRVDVVIRTGDGWVSHEYTVPPLKKGWNKNVSVDLLAPEFRSELSAWRSKGYLAERGEVKSFGVTVYPGAPGNGNLSLDNIRLVRRGLVDVGDLSVNVGVEGIASWGDLSYWPPGLRMREGEFSRLQSFETAPYWDGGSYDAVVEPSSEFASHGANSLSVTFPASPDGVTLNCVGLEKTLAGKAKLRFDVYNPGREVDIQISLMDNKWGYYGSNSRTIGHGWNTVIFDFGNAEDWYGGEIAPQVLENLFSVSLRIVSRYPGRLYFDGLSGGDLALEGAGQAGAKIHAAYTPSKDLELSVDYRAEDVFYGDAWSNARNAPPEAYLEAAKLRYDLGKFRSNLLYRSLVTSFDNPKNGLIQPWSVGYEIVGVETAGRLGKYEMQALLASRLEYERYNDRMPTGLGPESLLGFRVRRDLSEESRMGISYTTHESRYGAGVAYKPPRLHNYEVDFDGNMQIGKLRTSLVLEGGVTQGKEPDPTTELPDDDKYYTGLDVSGGVSRLSYWYGREAFGYYFDTDFLGKASNNVMFYSGAGYDLAGLKFFERLENLPYCDETVTDKLSFKVNLMQGHSRDVFTDAITGEEKWRFLFKDSNLQLSNDPRAKPSFFFSVGIGENGGFWSESKDNYCDAEFLLPLDWNVTLGCDGRWSRGDWKEIASGLKGWSRNDYYDLSVEKYFTSQLHLKTNLSWRLKRRAEDGVWGEQRRYFKWQGEARRPLGANTQVSVYYGFPALLGPDYGQLETIEVWTVKLVSYF